MNYIKHLNKTFELMYDDTRLSSHHVTLYMALFQQWNLHRFKNPLRINRHEIMKAARISSLTTYTRCIRELHEWEYLSYMPSRNPLQGTQVYMYSQCTGPVPESGTQRVQVNVQPLYINNTKQNKESETKEPPSKEEVDLFFKKEEYPQSEGKKFFNHYEATGWKIAGTIPMVNWMAAAHKWMINTETFTSHGNQPKNNTSAARHLQAATHKTYSEPL